MKLDLISYTEAEEFCLDVRRHVALGLGEPSVTHVVADVSPIWAGAPRGDRKLRVTLT